MPGFQINNALLRTAMRSRIVFVITQNWGVLEIGDNYQLPSGIVDILRSLAGLFGCRTFGTCEP
jgi:hypothetical protein